MLQVQNAVQSYSNYYIPVSEETNGGKITSEGFTEDKFSFGALSGVGYLNYVFTFVRMISLCLLKVGQN